MNINRLIRIALFLFILLTSADTQASTPIVISLSTDGHYAVSSHLKKELILWDITHKTKKIISKNVNIYSAYFIKHSHQFMWQDDMTHIVHIQNTDGKPIRSFQLSYPTYGHIMSTDLTHYFASDENWNIYANRGINQKLLAKEYNAMNFDGTGKIINFSIFHNKLLAAGTSGFTTGIHVWDINSKKVLFNLTGCFAQTVATFSPDGQYIIGGDTNWNGFLLETKTGKRKFELDSLFLGKRLAICDNGTYCHWDKTGLIEPPKDFRPSKHMGKREEIFNLKFIDQTHYLRFTTHIPQYAVLYQINNPKPIKYLKLDKNPRPAIDDYSRATTIDTSPQAHILVMGQAKGEGIIVYQYAPQKQILQKIW